jgi:excisionase family DNA binding protein
VTSPVVVLTPEQLRELVRDAVREALDDRAANEAPAPDREWLDASSAGALLGVHARSVIRMAQAGKLRGTRLGKLWRFRRSDVDALLVNELVNDRA